MYQLYPKLRTKPALPEDARRFGLQADEFSKDGREADAIFAYEKAKDAAPWWPQASYNRALL